MVPTIKDSRGRESTTLGFVTVGFATLLIKFALAGLDLPVVGEMPPMTATEFGLAATGLLGIWLGREWTEKRSGSS